MNQCIIDQCKKEYPQCDTILDKINYKIDIYEGGIQRISWGINDGSLMHCLCDGYHMLWYGDHGSFSFDCTWKTSLFKIPFQSPYYLFEKLDSCGSRGTGKIWDPKIAKEAVLEHIYETSWWEEEIESDLVKDEIKQMFEGPHYKDSFYYHTGEQDEEMLDALKNLINETENEWRFATCLNDLPQGYPVNSDDYDLYECGNVIIPSFWFILMCLNYIYDREVEKQENDSSEIK